MSLTAMDADQIKPGVYRGMAESVYHSDPCASVSLSSGVLRRLINGTPAHAYAAHPRLGGGDDGAGTPRTDFGSAAHRYVLGRGAEVAVLPFSDFRKKEAQEARDEARKERKIPLLLEQFNAVQKLVAPARAVLDTIAAGIGEAEVSIVWTERFLVDGEWFEFTCRARLDMWWLESLLIIDYKTCSDCSPETFGRLLFSQDYDLQRAFYLRGVTKLFGHGARFGFLAQEMDTGICCLHEPDEHSTELAAAMVEQGMRTWAQCLKRGEWPGYGTQVHAATMPAWKAQRIEYARMR